MQSPVASCSAVCTPLESMNFLNASLRPPRQGNTSSVSFGFMVSSGQKSLPT